MWCQYHDELMQQIRVTQRQLTIFSTEGYLEKNIDRDNTFSHEEIVISQPMSLHFQTYTLRDYIQDVETIGLEQTWNRICDYVLTQQPIASPLLQPDAFGALYEQGLAIRNKQQKKDSGQYYTPKDVALVMSRWLLDCKGDNICDVACGTGNLILTFLDLIGINNARKIIQEGRLYLYDVDIVALRICKISLAVKYGVDIADKIHAYCCDFLDHRVVLPPHAKVISNPPFAAVTKYEDSWMISDVLATTREFYAAFMEKICTQAESAVIITPFSFISGNKFYTLRKQMCDKGSGFIVSFDNVPGNIFNGKKQGVFNTNTANSVRAAITVFSQNKPQRGFRTSHLIRFKTSERPKLLNNAQLESFLSSEYQCVNAEKPMFGKVDRRLNGVYNRWRSRSSTTLKALLTQRGKYIVSMPNTCRYFTVASNKEMNRRGQIILSFNDIDVFHYVFCLLNSSFAYWHWRIYDGGITYSIGLLEQMPVFFDKLSADDKVFLGRTAAEMIAKEQEFIVTKKNVGVQENIKYPREYRDSINRRFLDILGIKDHVSIFDVVHSNMALQINISI